MPQRPKIGCLGYFGIIFVTLIVGVALWIWASFPTASYRYRLTIAVEANGQVYSGSSVIEVKYTFHPSWFAGGTFESHVKGQAVLIDMGARSVLLALLHSGTGSGHVGNDADALAGRAFLQFPGRGASGFPVTFDNVRAISRMRGSVDLTLDNLPPFIWLPDVTNPETAVFASPADFSRHAWCLQRSISRAIPSSSISTSDCRGTMSSKRTTARS